MSKEAFTVNEAAAELGVSPSRVRQMALDGSLPSERFGRALVFTRAVLDKAKKRKTSPGPAPKSKADETANRSAKKKAISRWENEGGAVPKGKKKGGKK